MVLAIAHRAGNSLAAMHAANELGVDVIECDVHTYRGRLEVRHLRTAGPLPFLWDRGELVSASAPRFGLQELLEADEHGTLFMLDLKGPWTWAGRNVARMLHDGGHHRPVLACGRWWPSVDAMAHLPYVRPVLSARNRVEWRRLTRRLARGPTPYGVSVHRSLLDAGRVADLHRHVELVMTWPVNDSATLEAVLEMGVDGVISDEHHVLAEVKAHTR
jgi:glycerophosphoryl diester phosphodiesterase